MVEIKFVYSVVTKETLHVNTQLNSQSTEKAIKLWRSVNKIPKFCYRPMQIGNVEQIAFTLDLHSDTKQLKKGSSNIIIKTIDNEKANLS
jgi:hypothetical protein